MGASGAADVVAHDAANRLVGNGPDAATLEVTLGGLRARLHGDATVAVTGDTDAADSERRTPTALLAPPPSGRATTSRWASRRPACAHYLAVRGGIDVPPVLGSRATDTLSGIGPAPVRAEDACPWATRTANYPPRTSIRRRPPPQTRRTPGPDGAPRRLVHAASRSALVQRLWTVTTDTDRVGARLDGAGPLHRARTGELPSEGMVSGALQVPPNGMPVLFLADHPVTGGYPVIAVVLERRHPGRSDSCGRDVGSGSGRCSDAQLRRWRAISDSTTPAATDALSDSTSPAIGMLRIESQVSRTRRDRPLPSEPTTMTTGTVPS
ncbi:allophanate hydrolase subunit 2 family protein [Rhodococcus hoagii]|nr:allophanate hydrolase subunit 2 family protein [Prescottella equi]